MKKFLLPGTFPPLQPSPPKNDYRMKGKGNKELKPIDILDAYEKEHNPFYPSSMQCVRESLCRLVEFTQNTRSSPWIKVTPETMPSHDKRASEDVLWRVVNNGNVIAQGIGNVGTDGEWYKSGIAMSWKPSYYMPIPEAPDEIENH